MPQRLPNIIVKVNQQHLAGRHLRVLFWFDTERNNFDKVKLRYFLGESMMRNAHSMTRLVASAKPSNQVESVYDEVVNNSIRDIFARSQFFIFSF